MAEYYPVYGYKKYYKDGENDGTITGTILLLNSAPNILVVDVDNKGATTSDRQQLCDELIKTFVPTDTSNVYIERTANYGLHIILTNDLNMTDVSKNRWCNIY